jgi:hypothetical protein
MEMIRKGPYNRFHQSQPKKGTAHIVNHKIEPSEHDFPRGVGQPALRALLAAGYTRLDQLTHVKEADLLKLHGMGPKAIGLLRSALEERGKGFGKE